MLRQISRADLTAMVGAGLGMLVAFLPWYGYANGAERVTVNAFRASALGDMFVLAVIATVLLILIGRGVIDDVVTSRVPETTAYALAAGIAMASALTQLIAARAGGRSLDAGIFLALVAATGLCSAAVLRRLHSERRRTVRELLAEPGGR